MHIQLMATFLEGDSDLLVLFNSSFLAYEYNNYEISTIFMFHFFCFYIKKKIYKKKGENGSKGMYIFFLVIS